GWTGGLAAGDAHVAGEGRALVAAVDDEVVALGLAPDRLVDGGIERVVALRGAQRRAQIRRVVLAEAHVERAGAGDAHAVARLAEVMGERRDEAEPSAGFPHGDVARRTARAIVDLVHGEARGEPRAHHRGRQ